MQASSPKPLASSVFDEAALVSSDDRGVMDELTIRFAHFINLNKERHENMALPVAAMVTLAEAIEKSKEVTFDGICDELRRNKTILENCPPDLLGGRTRLSLISGCELFLKFVMKLESKTEYNGDIGMLKSELRSRATSFSSMCKMSRLDIAHRGKTFFKENCTVLVHGCSRVVLEVLFEANKQVMFNIIVTQNGSEAGSTSKVLPEQLASRHLNFTLIEDRAVAAIMDQVDFCLVGAEAVFENGGIINNIGAFQVAVIAKAMKKPFYVAAESYKFTNNIYPLTQRDALELCRSPSAHLDKFRIKKPIAGTHFQSVDYTPAEYITLLFTDLGVLTPQAVYEETIKMYQ